jgi:DNA-binding transcriptional regulator YiaG
MQVTNNAIEIDFQLTSSAVGDWESCADDEWDVCVFLTEQDMVGSGSELTDDENGGFPISLSRRLFSASLALVLAGSAFIGSGGVHRLETITQSHLEPTSYQLDATGDESHSGTARQNAQVGSYVRSTPGESIVFIAPPERLTFIKDKLSLTTTDIAYVIGVTRATVHGWTRGRHPQRSAETRLAGLAMLAGEWTKRSNDSLGKYVYSPLEGRRSILELLHDSVQTGSASAETAVLSAFDIVAAEQVYRSEIAAIAADMGASDSRSVEDVVRQYGGRQRSRNDVKLAQRKASYVNRLDT